MEDSEAARPDETEGAQNAGSTQDEVREVVTQVVQGGDPRVPHSRGSGNASRCSAEVRKVPTTPNSPCRM